METDDRMSQTVLSDRIDDKTETIAFGAEQFVRLMVSRRENSSRLARRSVVIVRPRKSMAVT